LAANLADVITCAKFQDDISGVTILQWIEFPIFLLIFVQQCSDTALSVKREWRRKQEKNQKKTKRNKKKLQDLIGYIFAQNTYAALPAPKLSCEVESQTLLTMPLFVKIGKGVSAP